MKQLSELLKAVDDLLQQESTKDWTDLHEELAMHVAVFRNSGLKILSGAAQGTPQVEEISREIAEKLVAMHLIVWQGLGQAMDEYTKETSVILRKHGVGAPAQPGPQTRFDDFDDAAHPCNIWWKEHGHLMMSGGGRREFIWACRGWIAREQLAEGVEVTGESMHESKPAPAQGTPEPPKVEEIAWQFIAHVFPSMDRQQAQRFIEQGAAILRPYFPPASQTPDIHETMDGIIAIQQVQAYLISEDGKSQKGYFSPGGWAYEQLPRISNMLKTLPATPANTARTDGWVDAKVRLPKAPETNDDPEFVYVKWTEAARWSGGEDEDNPRSASGYDTCLIAYLLENPKLISHWRELPAAPGSVPQARYCKECWKEHLPAFCKDNPIRVSAEAEAFIKASLRNSDNEGLKQSEAKGERH